MKFANVHSAIISSRFALRLAFFSVLCLVLFAMSSPRLGVAPAAGAATITKRAPQSQKREGGKTSATQTKAVARADGKAEAKVALKSEAGGIRPLTVCAQNQPITSGQTVNGVLTASDCNNPFPLPNGQPDNSKIDEYTFTGNARQQVTITMTSSAFDAVLYLLDSNNNILAFNDDSDANTTNARIALFTLPANGTYSILANSLRPYPEEQGAYALTLTGGATCTTTQIAYGETKSGTLNSGDCSNFVDEDGTPIELYTFSGTAGQQIAITMTATSGNIDPYLYLLTPSGDLLADDNNGGGGSIARLPPGTTGFGRLPITGTYTIVANTVSATQSGNYNITLTKAATDCASATLTVGTAVNGSLASGDCRLIEDGSFIDAYTFTGTANAQVVITMTSATSGLVPVVFLLAPNGDVLQIDPNQDGDNAARIPNDADTFTLPTNGNYTVLVNSAEPNQTGNYTLRVGNSSDCTTTLASTSSNVAAGGGQFTVGFTTQPGCAVSAISNASFIAVNSSPVDANGAGTVTYTVQANTTNSARTGTITINGQTFSVTQAVSVNCTYAIHPTVRPFTEAGGTNGRFVVIAPGGCPWTATRNVPWITITEGASGSGTGRVRYTVEANTTTATRVGTITVAGVTHTVTQTSAGTTPQIQFSGNAEFTVNENDASRAATITVTRTGDTAGAVTVEYATLDDQAAVPCDPNIKNGDTPFPQGTAYARCDYATTIDTLTFNIGETSKAFTIPLINDVFQENNERFRIELRNVQGATISTLNTATITIQSEDLAPPTTNPINQTSFFVRQQYLDFLDREPEPGEPWTGVLNRCGNIFTGPEVNTDCDRIAVSGAFFGSPEFRIKGFFVFLHYKAAFGSANNPLYVPEYNDFVSDARRVSGLTAEEVIAKRFDFSEDFLARTNVGNIFSGTTNEAFVDRVLSNLGIALTNADPATGETRNSLVNALNAGTKTRAQVLRIIVESTEAIAAQFNRAFVAIQYYGYLRRTPEPQGYQNNLNALNATNNSRQLINGFLNSIEYRLRFGANTVNP